MFDIVIKNASVLDGSGAAAFTADVGVKGERITAIGAGLSGAKLEIDGAGKTLAPGFIDCHSHEDTCAILTPDVLPKITQGVTTVVVGNCGITAAGARMPGEVPDPLNLLGGKENYKWPTVAAYRAAVDAVRPSVNVATYMGHISLRNDVMDDLFRPANKKEIDAMRVALRQGLAEGAIGLSTGLAYATSRQSTTEEVMSLAEELTPVNGLYATHLRNEFEPILDAINEALAIGRHANVPVHIAHLKCAGVANWGRTVETLGLLEEAAKTQDVGCDCYPYTAGSATLDPGQVTADFEIFITWSDPHPDMAGKTLADIASAWGVSLDAACARLMPAGAIYHNMSEADMHRVLSHPLTCASSDGLPMDPKPHPRLWGAFPRILGPFCRDLKLFSLPQAVHMMTGRTAKRFGLADRGLIREDAMADLVLFDAATIKDEATFLDSKQPASGIEAVIVNGVLTTRNQQLTGSRAGRFLTRA